MLDILNNVIIMHMRDMESYFYMSLILLMMLCTRAACCCHRNESFTGLKEDEKITNIKRNFRYSLYCRPTARSLQCDVSVTYSLGVDRHTTASEVNPTTSLKSVDSVELPAMVSSNL